MTTRNRRSLNKLRFFADLKYEPHEGQAEIHASNASRRVVACGVRWGKTICAAMEGLAAAMAPRERSVGWVVAPTYDLADRVFRQLVISAASHLRHRIISLKEHDRRLLIRNMAGGESEIRAKSADNPVSLLGEGLDWLVVDEAARMKPMIWDSHLSQRLLDRKGWALLISTPRGKGWFYEMFRRGQGRDPDYQSWNRPSWTSPYLDADQIERERGRLPERVFLQEYGAAFVEGAGQVFRNVRECATGEWEEPRPNEHYQAGLDLAKIEDFTVLVITDSAGQVVFADRFHRLDWSLQVSRIKVATDRYNRALTLVDSTGTGEPVLEALLEADIQAVGMPFTQRTKTALINNLALMLERQEIILPRPDVWPAAIDELEAFQYSVSDAGAVKTGAPSGMHDDCVIAIALALWQGTRIRPTSSALVF